MNKRKMRTWEQIEKDLMMLDAPTLSNYTQRKLTMTIIELLLDIRHILGFIESAISKQGELNYEQKHPYSNKV